MMNNSILQFQDDLKLTSNGKPKIAIKSSLFSVFSNVSTGRVTVDNERFSIYSRSFNLFFWCLDYAGISLMIVSSFVPPIYYAFYCHPNFRSLYLTSITVLGIFAIITLLACDRFACLPGILGRLFSLLWDSQE
ncbi:hypothetical protein IFM89_032608 [Coptis chinensis]|uniref:Uncharacterized protein n=1 Tax=Coptis chinensis TaxID=261450 RepID=A0A835MAQ2_9MAGN|nr:hypothetical protein IFM89_032608 [Coptis chinensis]